MGWDRRSLVINDVEPNKLIWGHVPAVSVKPRPLLVFLHPLKVVLVGNFPAFRTCPNILAAVKCLLFSMLTTVDEGKQTICPHKPSFQKLKFTLVFLLYSSSLSAPLLHTDLCRVTSEKVHLSVLWDKSVLWQVVKMTHEFNLSLKWDLRRCRRSFGHSSRLLCVSPWVTRRRAVMSLSCVFIPDLLAVPKHPYAAMENWGLSVFVEQKILLDAEVSSSSYQMELTMVVVHEICHQVGGASDAREALWSTTKVWKLCRSCSWKFLCQGCCSDLSLKSTAETRRVNGLMSRQVPVSSAGLIL